MFAGDMERIRLTMDEKHVFLHVNEHGEKRPMNITPVMFIYCLSTLKEKGLVDFKSDYDDVVGARLTIKGRAYIDQNPKLTNPIDWKWIITAVLTALTAFATTLALFISCSMWNK